ncbi:run domain Beclin-1-interacting and cysteine-rich domain-containing protein isoform X3 [Agrilus planipennis]|uniref:Run domain Beclin-1-interacting and cysteine-rich domain-containing protein isoform X3 n=1 Tax=Agrilus planipennis TaxID=224129 RepID=A0A1W4WN95_AGRPL|nr:run domain Beclin-1-interacting and cysteine-rich domain-containing protein isoform X3 [Agrilus planipennis]
MSGNSNYPLKYQLLLRNVKNTVENLLISQLANVWFVYGGLSRLHNAVEKVFKHGCKVNNSDGCPDFWTFVQGLDWLQPHNAKSSSLLDCELKQNSPQYLKNNKASIWLYNNLENHSLSQKLAWLLSDKTHLHSCYYEDAFLCQEKYAEAILLCLRAVEHNQPSLISEIKPCLFFSSENVQNFHKAHRRCSSFPDNHLHNIYKTATRSKTYDSLNAPERKTFHSDVSKVTKKNNFINGKLKPWSSMPDLISSTRPKQFCKASQSKTTPSTPIITRSRSFQINTDKIIFTKDTVEEKNKEKNDNVMPQMKHVIFDNINIIEYTQSKNTTIKKSKKIDNSKLYCSVSPTRSSSDYSFLTALAGEKDYKRAPKKSFIEEDGKVLPPATGYFPRPVKGQTLASFLTSSQFVRANAELDRENAHFSISEAMIAVMEQIKCKQDLKLVDEQGDESDEEIMSLKQRIRLRRRQKLQETQKKMVIGTPLSNATTTTEASTSAYSTSPDYCHSDCISSDEVEDLEIDESSNLIDSKGLSVSMASLFSESDLLKKPRGAPDGASDVLSAEGVALSLISRFSEKQLPRASDLEWLVSEEDAPQALLPLPKSWPVDTEEVPPTPLRGNKDWAPPRPQIIFTPQPPPMRKKLMVKQNYRCAGCGTRVLPQYASKFRFCHYLGRYFCTLCHTNQVALIPGRIIQKWDFSRYPVSNFSYRLLEQMYADPLLPVFDLNKNIENISKNLKKCRTYRLALYYVKDFIKTCRFAEKIQEYIERENPYIYMDPDVYSLQDLVNIRSGDLNKKLESLVDICCKHIYECQLCKARGFICEVCLHDQVIFPWQIKKVTRCKKCGSCYHISCWKPEKETCLKCARLEKRKNLKVENDVTTSDVQ